MSDQGQKAKFRGDQRMPAFASKADISRFMSARYLKSPMKLQSSLATPSAGFPDAVGRDPAAG
jgi:hypothetical protein